MADPLVARCNKPGKIHPDRVNLAPNSRYDYMRAARNIGTIRNAALAMQAE